MQTVFQVEFFILFRSSQSTECPSDHPEIDIREDVICRRFENYSGYLSRTKSGASNSEAPETNRDDHLSLRTESAQHLFQRLKFFTGFSKFPVRIQALILVKVLIGFNNQRMLIRG